LPVLDEHEKTVILKFFGRLAFARGEMPAQYNFKVWIEVLEEKGYNSNQIQEMIFLAEDLPKYNTLGIGDLISNYIEVTGKDKPINYREFSFMLERVLEHNKAMLDKLSQMFLGVDFITVQDKKKFMDFIGNYIEDWNKAKLQEASAQENERVIEAVNSRKKLDEIIKQEKTALLSEIYTKGKLTGKWMNLISQKINCL